MSYVLSPKGFLTLGGIVLVLVAVLGYVGVIGPTAEMSLFGQYWYFDNAENIAHLVLGVVALAGAMMLSTQMQRYLALLVAVIALVAALVSLIGPIPGGGSLLGAMLQNPTDTVLHVVVAVWAFMAYRSRSAAPMMSSTPSSPMM